MSKHRLFRFKPQAQGRASLLVLASVLSLSQVPSAQAALHRPRAKATVDLKQELLKSPDVGTNVQVKNQKGVVTISGSVSNLYTKMAAVHLAKRQPGVKHVVDHLKVAPVRGAKKFPTDAQLAQKVQSLLAYDSFLGPWDLHASVKSGKVTLKGELPTKFHRGRAARLAARVTGVKALANKIRIQERPKGQKDADVAKAVRKHLSSNSLLAREKIKVDVDNGVVKLEGKVESWKQAKLASKLAYQSGAKIVHNMLSANEARSVSASIPSPKPRASETGAR